MKDTEMKVLIELMKNSRRSDRELARAIGLSQPTVSRIISKLENEGYIKEYTIVPDFYKLGFQMMSVILTRIKTLTDPETLEKYRAELREEDIKNPKPALMTLIGSGLNHDRVAMWLHEDYSAYSRSIHMIRQHPLVMADKLESFTVDLCEKDHFIPFTLSHLAKYLEKKQKLQQSKE